MLTENTDYNTQFCLVRFRILVLFIVIIGSLNWGAVAFGYNLVELLSNTINPDYHIDKIIYIIVAVCGILMALSRNTWLPFLGCTALPDAVISLKTPKSDMTVKVKVMPNAKVVYWAAFGKDKKDQHVTEAYADYSNSGVVMADSNGIAQLSIIEGGPYHTSYKTNPRHIHYRVSREHGGMLGPVETVFY
jgi:uncharacterized membrane protein YuzA (DUF378 family)